MRDRHPNFHESRDNLRDQHATHFPHLVDYRRIESGHNQPFDAPTEVAHAVLDLQALLESARSTGRK